MCKWFFMLVFISVAASDENLITFNPNLKILTNCIEHHFGSVDDKYQLSRIAKPVADLAARRFRGKSLSSNAFNKRFNDFMYQLRNNKINHTINQDDIPDLLNIALKEVLLRCAVKKLINLDITTSEKSVEVTFQDDEWISFNQNKNFLSKCIKNNLKLTGRHEFQKNDEFTAFIADCTARRICGKSFSRKNFLRSVLNLFHNIRNNKIYHNVKNNKLSAKLESLVRKAAEDCADNKLPLTAVPDFEIEPFETSELLNLILVKWQVDLRYTIQLQAGRAMLRKYANDALTALTREFNICQNKTQVFRLVLRTYWNNRAQEMFDANSANLPYIVHRYTENYPTPHMVLSDFTTFLNRKNKNFEDRDPFVSMSYVNEILNIHKPGHHNNKNGVDIFDDYRKNGMTSAEYYLENQLNQFYRIIFFFLELCARGICTDEDDVYYRSLPNNLVSKKIQAIIYDDDIYSDYLLEQRYFYKLLMDGHPQNEITQTLFENARVLEENLILLKSNIPSTSGIQLRSQPVKKIAERSTSAPMHSLKRKDDVWKNKNGKCFPSKRVKAATLTDSNGSINKAYTENLNHVSNSPIPKSNNHSVTDSTAEIFSMNLESFASSEQDNINNNNVFGYIMFANNYSNQLLFSLEDLLLLEELPLISLPSDEHCIF